MTDSTERHPAAPCRGRAGERREGMAKVAQ
jgi:hypothetical protein